MSILATSAIQLELERGSIVCDPLPERIEGAHIDIHLGTYFYRRRGWLWALWRNFQRPRRGRSSIVLWRDHPEEWFSGPHSDALEITVPARGFILAHTVEFIGAAPGSNIVPMLHTRSTLARWGLSVCTANAGQGDNDWISRWTLEILNPHPVDIALPVGGRIGSISFHRTEGEARPYPADTRYNATASSWTPELMLPKAGNW